MPIGIITKNEIKTENMIDILEELHKYVPKSMADCESGEGTPGRQQMCFSGDQLTRLGHRREEQFEQMPKIRLLHCVGLLHLQQTGTQKSILCL